MTAHRLLIALALVAGFAAGCGGGSCPTETPRIDAIQSCTAQPGQTVNVSLRLCPTCNQTGITCEVDTSTVSAGYIQLDPVAERCEGSSSCPPSCSQNEAVCSFKAPAAPGDYTLRVFDPFTNQTREGTLTVGGTYACNF
jgi:hypothetical protein